MGIRHFCDNCPCSYTKKSNLNDHIRFNHEGKGAKCDHCETLFKHDYKLQQHIEVKHPVNRPRREASAM